MQTIKVFSDTEVFFQYHTVLTKRQYRQTLLNISKCHVMRVFHPRKNKISSFYRIHSHTLSFVDHHKYLGIIIQNDLKWHQHIQSITSKANQTLALLIRNLRTLSIQLRERAYLSLVRPKLEYAAAAWDPHLTNDKFILEKVQRRAARYVKGTHIMLV